jgi:hypothetical protein
MLARNPMRMDYYKKYQEIIADYNREKDRATVEETFAKLVELAKSLDAKQHRAAAQGLSDDELALVDLLFKDTLSKADRERLKQASRSLLAALRDLLRPMADWTQRTTTQAEVRVFILDNPRQSLAGAPAATVYRRGDRRSRESCVRLRMGAQREWGSVSGAATLRRRVTPAGSPPWSPGRSGGGGRR